VARVNYYELLGGGPDVNDADIRRRFHQLAREGHPDRAQAEEKAAAEVAFQGITEAFNTLRHPERRRDYDRELRESATAPEDGKSELLEAYLTSGSAAFRAGRYAEAADSFRLATKTEPKDGRGWHFLSMACAEDPRRLSMGMTAIREACKLAPMNVTYLKLAGDLFARGGLPLRAEKYYDEAIEWGGPNDEIELALASLDKT